MKNRQTEEFINFDVWFRTLKIIALYGYYYEINDNKSNDWKEYYDSGFTPLEAIDEDLYTGA